jgi:hypothetical protein
VNGGSLGQLGIVVYASGATVTSNKIVNTAENAILLGASDATIKDNIIARADVGIEFACNTGTVSGNTINGASVGFDMVPAAFTGVNHFNDVGTVNAGGC